MGWNIPSRGAAKQLLRNAHRIPSCLRTQGSQQWLVGEGREGAGSAAASHKQNLDVVSSVDEERRWNHHAEGRVVGVREVGTRHSGDCSVDGDHNYLIAIAVVRLLKNTSVPRREGWCLKIDVRIGALACPERRERFVVDNLEVACLDAEEIGVTVRGETEGPVRSKVVDLPRRNSNRLGAVNAEGEGSNRADDGALSADGAII